MSDLRPLTDLRREILDQPRLRKSRAKDPANPSKGGRPKGSLNKRTIRRIEAAKRGLSTLQHRSLWHLRDTSDFLALAMAVLSPWHPDGTERAEGNYERWRDLCELRFRYLTAQTPYEEPRLSAVALVPQQASPRTVVNVTILDQHGEKVWSDRAGDTGQPKLIEAVAETP